MFGLDPDTIRNIKQAIAKIPDIDKAILYGSRAKGNYHNGSDIDVTLLGKNLTLNNSVYPLMDALEDLYLPYMFDLSIFSNIDNESLIDHIQRAGKVFYQREKKLPKGWEIKKLGEVCEVITKGTTPTSIGFKFKNEGINFIKVESITLNGSFIKNKFSYISNKTHEALSRSQLKNGDILFSIAGALGRVAMITSDILPANTNQALSIIRLKGNKNILKEYVLLVLTSGYVLEQIEKFRGGVAQQNLSLLQMRSIEIPLPPLPEQKRIVAILDQAFTAIGKVKSNTEQNLKNARELFQSALQTEFANGKLKIKSGEWQEKRLGDVCEIRNGGTPKTGIAEYWGGNIKWLTPKDMGKLTSKYVDDTSKKISLLGLQKSSAKLIPANSVILSTRAPIGHLAINVFEMATNQGCRGIIPTKDISNEYLFYFLNGSVDLLNNLGVGATFKELSVKALSSVEIPFPPLPEQKAMIKKLDTLSTETKKLETIYLQKITDLDELKKSILQKAFKGEL